MISKIGIALLIILTIITTTMTIKKVSSEIVENKSNSTILTTTILQDTITPQNTVKPTSIIKPIVTKLPTAKIVIKPTQNISNNQCIITVSGQQYDVTNLRNTHSGGNIFECNTDMTNVYQGKHGSGLSLISKYLIGSANGQVMPTATQNNNTNREREEDDD